MLHWVNELEPHHHEWHRNHSCIAEWYVYPRYLTSSWVPAIKFEVLRAWSLDIHISENCLSSTSIIWPKVNYPWRPAIKFQVLRAWNLDIHSSENFLSSTSIIVVKVSDPYRMTTLFIPSTSTITSLTMCIMKTEAMSASDSNQSLIFGKC